VAAERDGRIRGMRCRVLADLGASMIFCTAIVPTLTPLMIQGPYDIPALRCELIALYTNTCPTGAYRGAGRPEATYYLERVMDLIADATGIDPAEVRRRNFIPPSRFPFTAASGAQYDSGEYAKPLTEVLRLADYPALVAEQSAQRRQGKIVGIGVSSYVEICGFGPWELGTVRVHKDGSATVVTGTSPHGQGDATGFAQIVADVLTIPIDQISVVFGDTLLVQHGGGTSGSRSMALGGSAVYLASQEVREQIFGVAAGLLEAAKGDLALANATVSVRGAPGRTVSIAQVAEAAYNGAHVPDDQAPGLEATSRFKSEGTTFPFGSHLCAVEVDAETGQVRIARYLAVDDCGRVINPLLVDGQIHGGIAQGVSQALLENVVYDPQGQLLTGTLSEYGIPNAHLLPRMERGTSVTPTPRNPLGAKGIGEAATIGSTPAVVNAVVDALSHLGVRHLDMPLTPERILDALRQGSSRRKA
jgi:carbon-monoxide dehydrogenase large subunit